MFNLLSEEGPIDLSDGQMDEPEAGQGRWAEVEDALGRKTCGLTPKEKEASALVART